jgi:tetratricopeptide (TPR) repeat protein
MKTSEKNRTIRAAEKFLAQGKIPAAIQEYKRLLAVEPDDFTLLNTLGDLYARVDNKEEAVACFSRVAQHYRQQGFALKAIAMYKKISRLTPTSLEVAMNLAELYEQQRLTAEARAQYLAIADAYTRAKNTRAALDMMRRIADLDPQNIEVRLRLADSFHREGMCDEASEAFSEAGARLLARGDAERALDAFIRAVSLKPDDALALQGFVEAHTLLGTAEDAVALLERIVAEQPDNAEFLAILARAYLAVEDAPSAERVTEDLMARDAESYVRFYEVARLYVRGNSLDAAVNCLARVIETALARRNEEMPLEILNEVLARNPEHLDALRLVIRIYMWRRDDERAIAALEHLAEVAHEIGDNNEERAALAQLMRLAPDNENYRERLRAAGGLPEGLLSFDAARENEHTATSFGDKAERAGEFSQLEHNSLAFEPTVLKAEASASFADLSEDVYDQFAIVGESSSAEAHNPASGLYEFKFDAPNQNAAANNQTVSGAKDERMTAMLREELESVDFYVAQGYTDIARDTLDMLERQYGAHAEIEARRAQLRDDAFESETRAAEAQFEIANDARAASAGGFVNGSAASEHSTEAAQFSQPGAVAEEHDFILPLNAKEGDAHAAQAEASFADLNFAAHETAEASAPLSKVTQNEESPHQNSVTAAAADVSASTQTQTFVDTTNLLSDVTIDPGLAEIFDEFRHAVEEDQPATSGDFETHYNLGLAYKEMDLLDEAIEEFQNAVSLVAPQDGTPRYLQCCNLLGHCFMQKNLPRPAAMWFKKGLDAPGHTEDEYQALRYELGSAYEAMGDYARALDVFYEVYGINVGYRGVAEKLRELQAQKAV